MPDALAASLPENTAGKIHDLIYVASDNPHNPIAAEWFFKEVHPRLTERLRMCVIGKMSAHIANNTNVVKIPFAKDNGPYYYQSKVAIFQILSGPAQQIKK